MFRLTKHRTLTHVILATTALILAANYYIRDALYALGLDLIRQMQADHSDMGRLFFQLVTMASEPGVVAVVVLGILVGEAKRKHAFNVTMFMLLNIYLITLLKVLYVDPRPFWSVEHIHNLALYCPAEFGNPSGHSWFITVLLFLLLLKYFPWLPRVSALLGVTVVVALVATSRMYLGAHSLNQVVLGVTLGMVLNCLYYICGLDDRITEFLEDFNREPRLGWKKYMLLCQGLTFLAYFYAETDIARNADTYSRLAANARDQCGIERSPSQINFSMLLASCLVVNFCTGFALGYESMSLTERGRKYLEGAWEINEQRYPQWCGRVFYYLIQLACLVSGLSCALFLAWMFPLEKWVLVVVVSAGAMTSGYLFTRRCCEFLYRCSIICEIL